MAGLDLDSYRRRAERFSEEIDREYYLHFSGQKPEYDVEAIYERHGSLFERGAVEALHRAAFDAEAGEERRRLGHLLHFAFDGLIGRATQSESAELARLEASLEVRVGERTVPYRQVPVEQANEPDAGRRQDLEGARNRLLGERLEPLQRQALEVAHELAGELGWPSYAAAYAELRGIDLTSLGRRLAAFLRRTDELYAPLCDPELELQVGERLGEMRRSDLPRFFRAASFDGEFPPDRLVSSFRETLEGLGIRLAAQRNVRLDVEARPTKSPRAFCATPRVPQEIYLVVPPMGGRDDYSALFHEGGHTEHYAFVDAALPFEFRHLGDNSVTESFAFLFEHLIEDPDWLHSRLGVRSADAVARHARAAKLVMLRRYAGKIAYELELHSAGAELGLMPGRYAEILGEALRVEWPRASWLADVDGGFYVACYLRAWALEAIWRAALRGRFGARWFEQPEAGRWLRSLWREGQRLDADELVAEALGEELGFEPLIAEFAA